MVNIKKRKRKKKVRSERRKNLNLVFAEITMAGFDEDKTSKAVKKLQKSYFDVLGICCPSEVPLIENLLKPLDGVKEITVIVATRTVIVVHDSFLISQIQIGK